MFNIHSVALFKQLGKDDEIEQPKKFKLIRRLLPYISTFAILAYLYFHLKDQFVSEEFFEALRQADLLLLIAGVVIPFMAFILTNVVMTARLYTWFVAPLKMRDIWGVRGATLLLNLINPALAGGAWMMYLMRKTGAPILRILSMGGLGLTAVITWVHVIVTIIFTLMLIDYYPATEKLISGLRIYVIFGWVLFFHTVTFWLLGWKWGPINIIREWRINEQMRRAKLRHWAYVFAMVFPSLCAAFVGQYFCALAFDIVMPFHIFIGKFLTVIFYLFIPSVGGVGPLTWGWLNAFEGYAKPETIVACTLALITVGHITRVLWGLICLLPAMREIATLSEVKTEEVSEESIEPEAALTTPDA